MNRAIQIAKNGLGYTYPNPMVGCVIEKNGIIISEGWHYKCGKEHAEVKALNKIKDEIIFSKSIMYVTLEPCIHFGKTPPCVDLIIKKKISIVVIGIKDPSVNGLGIKKLREYGITVIEDFMYYECKILNKRFFTFHKKNRPFIILKWAQSNNGFINSINDKTIKISNIYSRQLNHKWRSEENSILVGTKTVLNDNPKLNIRYWFGINPVRILLDRKLDISHNYFVLDNTQKTIIFTEKNYNKKYKNIEYIYISFNDIMIEKILYILFKKNIQSLIIEGGKKIFDCFIEKNLWDECRIFISNTLFIKRGLKAPLIREYDIKKNIIISTDKLIIYNNKKLKF
ncbi:bifunctional diaminohydroxyphosphoribosylaminopyrimidine deaminase/5-amino-6-(5-phosphoribosylamino)uracil reductase RibD [Blattabacterium cuenoti]|uniref:bifunctional diaminohydroxyphosphoribosylaminopyrimidine deaminase/5-amino-6-(5-phosphoribosylamino)uracil reductase RibD n=1 Tax=Blattabacterium cuenoti TaxID=1653831 RepID=UPI001EEA9D68|nr:bifunctional diaminohydroxyphosphoribosylaminopyrimidine deaminase/5-amino-6-(5-phosphoribosylamino)uracil reductase RibD [Blattabacterium cuenoti]